MDRGRTEDPQKNIARLNEIASGAYIVENKKLEVSGPSRTPAQGPIVGDNATIAVVGDKEILIQGDCGKKVKVDASNCSFTVTGKIGNESNVRTWRVDAKELGKESKIEATNHIKLGKVGSDVKIRSRRNIYITGDIAEVNQKAVELATLGYRPSIYAEAGSITAEGKIGPYVRLVGINIIALGKVSSDATLTHSDEFSFCTPREDTKPLAPITLKNENVSIEIDKNSTHWKILFDEKYQKFIIQHDEERYELKQSEYSEITIKNNKISGTSYSAKPSSETNYKKTATNSVVDTKQSMQDIVEGGEYKSTLSAIREKHNLKDDDIVIGLMTDDSHFMTYIPIPSDYNDNKTMSDIMSDIYSSYQKETGKSIDRIIFLQWKNMPQKERQGIIEKNDFKYWSEGGSYPKRITQKTVAVKLTELLKGDDLKSTLSAIREKYQLKDDDIVIGFMTSDSDSMTYIPIPSDYNDKNTMVDIIGKIYDAYEKETGKSITQIAFYQWQDMPQKERQGLIEKNDFKYLSESGSYPKRMSQKTVAVRLKETIVRLKKLEEGEEKPTIKENIKKQIENLQGKLDNELGVGQPSAIGSASFFQKSCTDKVKDSIMHQTKNYQTQIMKAHKINIPDITLSGITLTKEHGLTLTFADANQAANAMNSDLFKAMKNANACTNTKEKINITGVDKIEEFIREECGVNPEDFYKDNDLKLDTVTHTAATVPTK